MNKTAKNLIIFNVLVLFGASAFVVASEIMSSYDVGCFIAERLYIYCPGCGGTRAVYAMLRFDIISAIRYNVAVPILALIYIYYNVKAIISIKKGSDDFFTKEKFRLIYIFIGVLLANFVLRNVLLWGFKIDFIGDFIPIS